MDDPATPPLLSTPGPALREFLRSLPELRANIVVRHSIDPLHFQNTLNS